MEAQILEGLIMTSDGRMKQGESVLQGVQGLDGFVVTLLGIVVQHENVRLSAVIYLKNFVKTSWRDSVSEESKVIVRGAVVGVMVQMPKIVQMQLMVAVSLIAECDFPDKFQNLIPDLVSGLDGADFSRNLGILGTMHLVFKRWRSQFESNDLFTEIKYVMEVFSATYMMLFKTVDHLLDTTNNQSEVLMESLLLLLKIFYSLNCQDLPEFFEDNMDYFLDIFKKYIKKEEGFVEVKTSICEIIDLYSRRYETDFKRLPEFVESIWLLLTTTSLDSTNDILVSKAITFLTSVVKHERHRLLFENVETLTAICKMIIVPNMTIREIDEELFVDEPMEYMKLDLFGSDSDTRRRAAGDLVRGLMVLFEKAVTEIFSFQIVELYAEGSFKSKDTALYLISSLAAKTVTQMKGATTVNEYIPIQNVYETHVKADLVGVNDILKVDCIKYLTIFRNHLNSVDSVPVLISLLSKGIVGSYAAYSLDKLLPGLSDKDAAIKNEIVRRILNMDYDEYILKCLSRVISTTLGSEILTKLSFIIGSNPTNPTINHYAFECLSTLIAVQPNLDYSQLLLALLQRDDCPYVYQIISQLIDASKSLSEVHLSILSGILHPNKWESKQSVPPLVNLLGSYLRKPIDIPIQPILGIFQKLIGSKQTDINGFDLLKTILTHVPKQTLAPYMTNIYLLLMTRLFQSKTQQFTRAFLDLITYTVLRDIEWISHVEAVQKGVVGSIVVNILIPELKLMKSPKERRLAVLAMTQLLQSPVLLMDKESWKATFTTVMMLVTTSELILSAVVDSIDVEKEEVDYEPSFNKLKSVKVSEAAVCEGVDVNSAVVTIVRSAVAKNADVVGWMRESVESHVVDALLG